MHGMQAFNRTLRRSLKKLERKNRNVREISEMQRTVYQYVVMIPIFVKWSHGTHQYWKVLHKTPTTGYCTSTFCILPGWSEIERAWKGRTWHIATSQHHQTRISQMDRIDYLRAQKNVTLQFCIQYRIHKDVSKLYSYPLARMDEYVHALFKSTVTLARK